MDEFKWQSNPILAALRPRLEAEGEEAVQFRAEIGLLHQRLDNYELLSGKGETKKRITLRNVFLREKLPFVKTEDHYGIVFRVELVSGRRVAVNVTRKKDGTAILTMPPTQHDPGGLTGMPGFLNLSQTQGKVLNKLYSEASPLWYCDLTTYEDPVPSAPPLQCGAYEFRCGKDVLFAGLVEVLYEMRCLLFHGELAPSKEAVACYEPAFRLVRRFLDCVV
jgi:hypothetical protein